MKFNDHFIVSQDLIDHNIVHDHRILDEGDNSSDHLPLLLQISARFQKIDSVNSRNVGNKSLNWKTRPYTRQHQSRAGGQGQYSSWAGAVTEI